MVNEPTHDDQLTVEGSTAVTIRMSYDLKDEIERLADRMDRSISWYIRNTLQDHVDRQPADSCEVVEGSDDPPLFDTYLRPGGYHAVIVEGYAVPHLKAFLYDTGNWALILDDRFQSQMLTREELWKIGWFLAQAMAVSAGYTSHGPNARRINPHGANEPTDWTNTDERGSLGWTYEITVGFSLPGSPSGQRALYELRGAFIRQASDAGARDVMTRLIQLGSLPPDPRDADEIGATEVIARETVPAAREEVEPHPSNC